MPLRTTAIGRLRRPMYGRKGGPKRTVATLPCRRSGTAVGLDGVARERTGEQELAAQFFHNGALGWKHHGELRPRRLNERIPCARVKLVDFRPRCR